MDKRISDAVTVALQFNDCINSRDADCLSGLMTDNHLFIDRANNRIAGKEKNNSNWKKFFDLFPDYRNIFETVTSRDTTVIMRGYSVCAEKELNCRAIWTAKIEKTKVKEWRVYDDTEENRIALGI
ncbi:hypothetical protein K7I13_02720 [Brucepastera parasyntrophica]|uniref:hypothetical protein n=1 Tax=Brucepastera parasyntrophica TaxID=2880008 RepID=UPI00210A4927|nr:hypothetical protein [Brucepastera parasyntrophica]ULQ60243.1 hypothetical protein K7I13_02720 [Brucepastera parasyntrophica]